MNRRERTPPARSGQPMTPQVAVCRECGDFMKVRTNSRTNQQFLGCQSYPDCRVTEPYDDVIDELLTENYMLRADIEDLCNQAKAVGREFLKLQAQLKQDRGPIAVELDRCRHEILH